jgi:hypothetical protein
VARTQTDGTGEWSTEKATYRDGGYYAKLRRKVIDNGDGSKTTCRPARSGGIEIG